MHWLDDLRRLQVVGSDQITAKRQGHPLCHSFIWTRAFVFTSPTKEAPACSLGVSNAPAKPPFRETGHYTRAWRARHAEAATAGKVTHMGAPVSYHCSSGLCDGLAFAAQCCSLFICAISILTLLLLLLRLVAAKDVIASVIVIVIIRKELEVRSCSQS